MSDFSDAVLPDAETKDTITQALLTMYREVQRLTAINARLESSDFTAQGANLEITAAAMQFLAITFKGSPARDQEHLAKSKALLSLAEAALTVPILDASGRAANVQKAALKIRKDMSVEEIGRARVAMLKHSKAAQEKLAAKQSTTSSGIKAADSDLEKAMNTAKVLMAQQSVVQAVDQTETNLQDGQAKEDENDAGMFFKLLPFAISGPDIRNPKHPRKPISYAVNGARDAEVTRVVADRQEFERMRKETNLAQSEALICRLATSHAMAAFIQDDSAFEHAPDSQACKDKRAAAWDLYECIPILFAGTEEILLAPEFEVIQRQADQLAAMPRTETKKYLEAVADTVKEALGSEIDKESVGEWVYEE